MSFSKRGRKLLGFRSYRVPSDVTYQTVEKLYESLSCPRSLACWILFKNQEFDQLVKLEVDPLHYNSLVEFRDAYMATKLMSKYEDFSLPFDLDEVAFAKFEKSELECRLVNRRFVDLAADPSFKGPVVSLHNAVVRKIQDILGEFNTEEFFDVPDWGPGASTLIKRRDASPQEKFQSETGITRDLYSLLPIEVLRGFSPIWSKQLEKVGYPNLQVGNKVVTVPKNSATNRVIAIEPGLNLFFQKSAGKMIERRLRRVGIDIRYQSRNQHLAKLASVSGELATVDFSSASDTISRELVRELLPPRWFSVLDSCRSHYGNLKGSVVRWEKFSSMGNGFTFPLETLIFYACAKACAEYLGSDLPVGAYGDDIVIPSVSFELYTELVKFYGFTINKGKSFSSSWFRESCGSHYYSGFDIKPVYFHRQLVDIADVYRQYNAIRRLSSRRGFDLGCDDRLRPACDYLLRSVPKALRLRIPEGVGDGGFIGNFDEATPARARHGVEGYRVQTYGPTSLTRVDEREGYLLAELWRLSKRGTSLESTPVTPISRVKAIEGLTVHEFVAEGRNSVPLHRTRMAFSETLVRQWTDLGPWFTVPDPTDRGLSIVF